MNRVETVDNLNDWQRSIPTLGRSNHAVTVWEVLSEDEAEEDAGVISAAYDSGRLGKEHVPELVVDAAFAIAKQSARYDITVNQGLRTNPTAFGGKNYPLTGLHADTHIDVDGKPKSAAFKCLYVGAGVVDAYFRLLPSDFLGASYVKKDEMLGDRAVPNTRSFTGLAMNPTAEREFLHVEARAGTLLAFPAAGDPLTGAAAAEHEIRSKTFYRVTIPLEDYLFRTAIRGLV